MVNVTSKSPSHHSRSTSNLSDSSNIRAFSSRCSSHPLSRMLSVISRTLASTLIITPLVFHNATARLSTYSLESTTCFIQSISRSKFLSVFFSPSNSFFTMFPIRFFRGSSCFLNGSQTTCFLSGIFVARRLLFQFQKPMNISKLLRVGRFMFFSS